MHTEEMAFVQKAFDKAGSPRWGFNCNGFEVEPETLVCTVLETNIDRWGVSPTADLGQTLAAINGK